MREKKKRIALHMHINQDKTHLGIGLQMQVNRSKRACKEDFFMLMLVNLNIF
jgi:hypothetical protein